MRTALAKLLCLALVLGSGGVRAEVPDELPALGDSASAVVSPAMERKIGEALLRQIRAQAPLVDDPILKYYTELNLFQLAEHSDLRGTTLTPVLIDDPNLNAFAAPGGVVGINLGLYLAARDVHEYSAVLAHELAHLSQRHFARGVEMQRRQTLPYLASMLAAIAIAATAGGDAGIAAISTAQAAAQGKALRYSRTREQEADRIGLNTLVAAGLDPYGMSRMFERMQREYRFTRRPPEFLLTHPLTESRITDARGQATGFARKDYPGSDEFQSMRARVQVHYADSPNAAVRRFRDRLEEDPNDVGARYGLIIALSRAGESERALDAGKPLFGAHPSSILFNATRAELLIAAGRTDDALDLLSHQLVVNPDNRPLSMLYAEALTQARRYADATAVLERQSELRPKDQIVWYKLAEVSGLAGNIVAVHRARAEYFALVGNFASAVQHLEYALSLVDESNFQLTAGLNQRITDFKRIQQEESGA